MARKNKQQAVAETQNIEIPKINLAEVDASRNAAEGIFGPDLKSTQETQKPLVKDNPKRVVATKGLESKRTGALDVLNQPLSEEELAANTSHNTDIGPATTRTDARFVLGEKQMQDGIESTRVSAAKVAGDGKPLNGKLPQGATASHVPGGIMPHTNAKTVLASRATPGQYAAINAAEEKARQAQADYIAIRREYEDAQDDNSDAQYQLKRETAAALVRAEKAHQEVIALKAKAEGVYAPVFKNPKERSAKGLGRDERLKQRYEKYKNKAMARAERNKIRNEEKQAIKEAKAQNKLAKNSAE